MSEILGADVREGQFCGRDEEGLIVPMGRAKRVQVQDRHEHGSLPDTVPPKTLGTRRLAKGRMGQMMASKVVRGMHVSLDGSLPALGNARWRVEVHANGHVTVVCHCLRCEAERVQDWRDGVAAIPHELYEKYSPEAERARDEARE